MSNLEAEQSHEEQEKEPTPTRAETPQLAKLSHELWQREAVPLTPEAKLPASRFWRPEADQQAEFLRSRQEVQAFLSGKSIVRNFNRNAIAAAYYEAGDDSEAVAALDNHLREGIFRNFATRFLATNEDSVAENNRYFSRFSDATITPEAFWFTTYEDARSQKVEKKVIEEDDTVTYRKQPTNLNQEFFPETKEERDPLTGGRVRERLLLPFAYVRDKELDEDDNQGTVAEVLFSYTGTDAQGLYEQLDATLSAFPKSKLFADADGTVAVPSNQGTERAAATATNEWREYFTALERFPDLQLRFVTLPIFSDEIDAVVERLRHPQPDTVRQVTTKEATKMQDTPVVVFEAKEKETIPSVSAQAFEYFCSTPELAKCKNPEQILRYILLLATPSVGVIQIDETFVNKKEGETEITGQPMILGVAAEADDSLQAQLAHTNQEIYNWVQETMQSEEHTAITTAIFSIKNDTQKSIYAIDTRGAMSDSIMKDPRFSRIQEAVGIATGFSQQQLQEVSATMVDLRKRGENDVLYRITPKFVLAVLGKNLGERDAPPALERELQNLLPEETATVPVRVEAMATVSSDPAVEHFFAEQLPTLVEKGVTKEELEKGLLPVMRSFILQISSEYEEVITDLAKTMVGSVTERIQIPPSDTVAFIAPLWNDYFPGLVEKIREERAAQLPDTEITVVPLGDAPTLRMKYTDEIAELVRRRYSPDVLSQYSATLQKIAESDSSESSAARILLQLSDNPKALELLRESAYSEETDTVLLNTIMNEKVLLNVLLFETIYESIKGKVLVPFVDEHNDYVTAVNELLGVFEGMDLTELFLARHQAEILSLESTIKSIEQKAKSAGNRAQNNKISGAQRKNLAKEAEHEAEKADKLRKKKTTLEKDDIIITRIFEALYARIPRTSPQIEEYTGGVTATKFLEAKKKAEEDASLPIPDPEDYIAGKGEPVAYVRDTHHHTSMLTMEKTVALIVNLKNLSPTELMSYLQKEYPGVARRLREEFPNTYGK